MSCDDENESYIDENEKSTKYSKTNVAAKISIKTNTSTRKAAKFCNIINEEGYEIPTPSQ